MREREKSTWELFAGVWRMLNEINFRRRQAALRQRNMLAGVVAVLLVDLLMQVFVR